MPHMPAIDMPADAVAVTTTRSIAATSPLRIDGGASADLSANRTVSLDATPGARLLGAASAGAPSYLTGAQATAILDAFTATAKGLVNPPGGAPTGQYTLLDNNTWGLAGPTTCIDVTRAPYNAARDGVTDARAAIQAAIDAAATAGGGVVYLPNGTYIVSRTSAPLEGCLYLKSNVTLLGESTAGVIIKQAANQPAFTRVIRIDTQNDITIRDLTIDGNKSGTAAPEEHMAGIFPGSCLRLHIDNVVMRNCCGDGLQFYSGCEDALVENCYVHDNDRSGISLTGTGAKRITIRKCQLLDNVGQQIDTEMSSSGEIQDVSIIDNYLKIKNPAATGYALTVTGWSGRLSPGFVVHGNRIEGSVYIIWARDVTFSANRVETLAGNASNAVVVDRECENIRIIGNSIIAGDIEPSSFGAVYVQGTSTSQRAKNVIISNNYIEQKANGCGVHLKVAKAAVVVNNKIVGNTGVASTRAAIAISTYDSATYGTQDSVIIDGNYCVDFGACVTVGGDVGGLLNELVITGNVFQRVSHATMTGLDLNVFGLNVALAATVANNTFRDITTTIVSWPAVSTLIGGNRGAGGIYSGTGSPEGSLTATVGALYMRRDGSAGTAVYIKSSGTGNTGWTPIGGVVATGSITCVAKASLIDGETVSIGDGVNPVVVYEFDTNGTVTAGNIKVDISADTTATDVAARLLTAISTNQPLLSGVNTTGVLAITHKLAGTFANVSITETVANAGFLVSGMSGGVNPAR